MFKVKKMKSRKAKSKNVPFGNKSMKGWKKQPNLNSEEVALLKNNGQ